MSSPTLYKIASIPGDGIGIDITAAAKRVLNALAAADGSFAFTYTDYDWSSAAGTCRPTESKPSRPTTQSTSAP
jgi:isocitrate/isopropylmalate dehydrogenase